MRVPTTPAYTSMCQLLSCCYYSFALVFCFLFLIYDIIGWQDRVLLMLWTMCVFCLDGPYVYRIAHTCISILLGSYVYGMHYPIQCVLCGWVRGNLDGAESSIEASNLIARQQHFHKTTLNFFDIALNGGSFLKAMQSNSILWWIYRTSEASDKYSYNDC